MPARTRTRKPARSKPATAAGRNGSAARGRAKPRGKAAAKAHRGASQAPKAKRGTSKAKGAAPKAKHAAPKPKRAAPKARKPTPRTARSSRNGARARSPKPRRGFLAALRERLGRATVGRLGGLRRKLALVVAVAGLLAFGYFGWLRDSPLVAIRDVEVAGVSGEQKQRIEKALTRAAKEMTTLHVREDALTAATASFPAVASVSADASFPSGLRVTVEQRQPALIARSKAQTLAVADDGALLPGVDVPKGAKLPAIDVERLPDGGRLAGADLEQALVVGATPDPLAPLVETVAYRGDEGVVVTLEGGLPVHFGTGDGTQEKWAAAAAVLADPRLKQVSYVDVRVPERAAAGGATPAQAPEASATAPTEPAAAVPDAPSTAGLTAEDPQTLE